MYTCVHMTMAVNITDFRKNIFKYVDLIGKGYEVEVERSGRKVFKTTKIVDDSAARAKDLAKALKAAAGKFPNWDINVEELRYGPTEKAYEKRMARLKNLV